MYVRVKKPRNLETGNLSEWYAEWENVHFAMTNYDLLCKVEELFKL